MYCHDLEVMSSNPAWVKLGVRSTSVLSRTWNKSSIFYYWLSSYDTITLYNVTLDSNSQPLAYREYIKIVLTEPTVSIVINLDHPWCQQPNIENIAPISLLFQLTPFSSKPDSFTSAVPSAVKQYHYCHKIITIDVTLYYGAVTIDSPT